MNRIENILLTLAVAAALLLASTANADPNDGLHGIPVVKTPNGTRMARDLELEEANADSGTKPEDGLPGRPVLRTPNGTRTARDLEAEQANHSNGPCPEDNKNNNRNTNGTRTRAADEASSLLNRNEGLPLDLPNTRTKDSELADRDAAINSLKDAATRNKNKNADNITKNTTLEKALKRAGIDPKRLKGAKTKTDKYGSTTITLADGTVIMTGSDSDGLGTSVTSPNGDQIEVYPDGRVTTRKGLKGDTITHHPNGTTTLYDPKQDSLTIVDKHGRVMTQPLDFFKGWYAKGWNADTILDLLDPIPGHKNPDNTTFSDTLRRTGISADDLKNATSVETSEHSDSVKITLKDGTEIWTGPDNDGSGSSVTSPNGDQTEVYPDGRVSTRKGKDGHTITTLPDGITLDYDPQDETLTVTDKHGNSETRNMDYWNEWFKAGHDAADLLRIYHDVPEND